MLSSNNSGNKQSAPKNQNQGKPKISENSKKIIEQKRYGNTGNVVQGSFGSTVHQRLHQAALAKQRALRTLDDNIDD